MTPRLAHLHVNLHTYDPAAPQAKVEAVVSFFALKGTTCPSKIKGLSPIKSEFSQLAFLVAC